MNLINLKILTPEGVYLEKEVYRIDVKTKSGNIGVLKGHIPMISGLDIGKLQLIDKDQKETLYALHGGLLNVTGLEATIITSAIESKEEIDKKRAEIAKGNAEKIIFDTKDNDKESRLAELALKRAIARLNI